MARPRKNEYLAGDFLTESASHKIETVEIIVDKKINLLYDFCALKMSKQHHFTDPRESAVRRILTDIGKQRTTVEGAEAAMTAALFGVVRFEQTIDQFIANYKITEE